MRQGSESQITGDELRQLILGKWGRSYDVRLQRRGSKVYLHVMWKHLEQRSFHLTAVQYQQQLDAVAEYLQARLPARRGCGYAVLCCSHAEYDRWPGVEAIISNTHSGFQHVFDRRRAFMRCS